MKVTDDAVEGAAKEGPASPPKKKLKQARLPFQILSPAVKPVEIKPRKRKASSTSDDLQIVVVGPDVKENQSVVPDKKLRLEHKEETKQKVSQEKQNVSKEKHVSEKNKNVKIDKSGDKKNSKIVISQVIEILDDSNDGELNKGDSIEENIDLNVVNSKVQSDKSKVIGEIKKDVTTPSKKIKDVVTTLSEEVKDVVTTPSEEVKDVVAIPSEEVKGVVTTPSEEVKDVVTTPSEEVKDVVTTPSEEVKDVEDKQEVGNLEKRKTTLGDDKSLILCESITDSESDKDNSVIKDESPSVTSSTKKSLRTPKSATKTSPDNGTSKIRKLTPKQLALKKERERAREEKERLKEEREKKRAEEKEEKQKLKNEKEDAKKREKEEKEKKRLAEIEAKNEEKRLKEEEKKAKEEERKKKEEERKQKEEEKKQKEEERKQKEEDKRLKEEAKHAEHRKSAAAFVNFFVTKKVDSKTQGAEENVEVLPEAEKFMPFEVKGDMRLAPLVRREFIEENKQVLDCALKDQTNVSECLYVQSLRGGKYVPATSGKTWPYVVDEDDDVIIVEAENPEGTENINEEKEEKKYTRKQRAKLIQFYDNRRPPYFGTWRKKSREIRPRAPFNMDKTMLEYEVDSDDEWEEIEEGESLRGSDDEESQDENYEEDNDMFVPHGYLSDEEGQDEMEDTSPEAQKAKLKLLQLEFEAERSEKQERQKPRLIGCVWFKNNVDDPDKVGSQIAELFLVRRAVWEGELPISLKTETTDCKEESPLLESISKKKTVPESVIPKVISLIHGNRYRIKFLIDELYEYFLKEELTPQPSRSSIARKIRELATWMVCPVKEGPPLAKCMCWYVSADVREVYGMKELKACQSLTWKYSLTPPNTRKQADQSMDVSEAPLPIASSTSSRITKFTKVLSKEERQKQLRSKNADSPSPATPTVNIKQVVPKTKKRVSLISVPPGEVLPKQNKARPLDNFIKTNKPSDQQNKTEEKQPQKKPKRITPISVPRKGPIQQDCVVLID